MPLVLVQNPVIVNAGYDWKDIEGQQYHFPNQYRNRCTPGTPFVYYRGTRRPDGPRGTPEYFGYGLTGEVWRDESIPESQPKRHWAWYCRIEDYVKFSAPVPAKIGGQFIEHIARNHWSVGIRPLPADLFEKILGLAGCTPSGTAHDHVALPDLSTVIVTEAKSDLLVPRTPAVAGDSSGNPSPARYSKTAARIGRRAEEIAYAYILQNATALGAKAVRWVAKEGLTPGWDIQFEDRAGDVIAVEVKGTAGPRFANIELTAGEWNAAKSLGGRYWLFLVADCCGKQPKIQRLQNPTALVANGDAQLYPVVFRFAAVLQLA